MSDSQRWLALALLVGLGWLTYRLSPVLAPFLLAMLLAYIGDPLADRLQYWGLSRPLSVVAVFSVLFLGALVLLLILMPLLERQVALLVARLPAYIDWAQTRVLPALVDLLGLDADALDFAAFKDYLLGGLQEAGGSVAGVLGVVSRSGMTVLAWLANLVLVPVVTFYMLRDWDLFTRRLRELLPRRVEPTVVHLAREADGVLGAFVRGQLTVMLALGSIYTAGLWLVGLELALLIGLLAGMVSFVPYLGFIVGLLAAGIAALVQFQELTHLFYVVAVFALGQAIEGTVLTPLLVGNRIGLHPVAVIFAVMAGGQLFGFVGVLLALPAAAVTMVLLRYAHERYLRSTLYGSGEVPPGP